MINKEEVRVLSQYILALEDAYVKLERAYMDSNLENMTKIKSFIKEVQIRIESLLKR